MSINIFILLLFTIFAFYIGKNRAKESILISKQTGGLSKHYGFYTAIWTLVPALLCYIMLSFLSVNIINKMIFDLIPIDLLPKEESMQKLFLETLLFNIKNNNTNSIITIELVKNYNQYLYFSSIGKILITSSLSIISFFISFRKIDSSLKAKNFIESFILIILFISSLIAILTTLGIILSLIFETFRFFQDIAPFDFFLGTIWSPQVALREGQIAASGSFGILPVFAGTLLITIIAMSLAGPIGLLSAIYLSEYASPISRKIIKPAIEVLAGVPTVVYGFFAALVVGPFIRGVCDSLGITASSESALAAGLVMGIMIIPFVSSLSDDVLRSVPQSLREASYGIGSTKSETIKNILIPAALPGIVAAFLLAISRAIGETMIVVMAAGLSAKLTANPLDSVTTVTVQIVSLLIGDHEFDSTKTMAAFALGMTLFIITLLLNIVALRFVQKYREKYD